MEQTDFLDIIIQNAEIQAEKIIEQAEAEADIISSGIESKIKRIRSATDFNIEKKRTEIQHHTKSAVEAEKRKATLKLNEKINSRLMDGVRQKLLDFCDSPLYDEFLSKLIAEGVIAINSSPVIARCSFIESITKETIEKAGTYVKSSTGKNVEIRISELSALTKQGIIVESENGRLSYNNQIDARLRRFDDEIRSIIIENLEKE